MTFRLLFWTEQLKTGVAVSKHCIKISYKGGSDTKNKNFRALLTELNFVFVAYKMMQSKTNSFQQMPETTHGLI